MVDPRKFNLIEQLQSVPIHNQAMQWENIDGENLAFHVQVEPPGGAQGLLMRWFGTKPRAKTIEIDKFGAWIFKQCDGQHTVEEIVERLAVQQKLTFHESRMLVTRFLKDLLQRGAIGMAIPSVDEEDENVRN